MRCDGGWVAANSFRRSTLRPGPDRAKGGDAGRLRPLFSQLFDLPRAAGDLPGGYLCPPRAPWSRRGQGVAPARRADRARARLRAVGMVGAGLESAGNRVLPPRWRDGDVRL